MLNSPARLNSRSALLARLAGPQRSPPTSASALADGLLSELGGCTAATVPGPSVPTSSLLKAGATSGTSSERGPWPRGTSAPKTPQKAAGSQDARPLGVSMPQRHRRCCIRLARAGLQKGLLFRVGRRRGVHLQTTELYWFCADTAVLKGQKHMG